MGRQKKIKDLQVKPEEVTQMNENNAVVEQSTQELEMLQQEMDKARIEMEALKKELTELKTKPMRELDDVEKLVSDRHQKFASGKAELKAKIEAQKAWDSQMVTGKFLNRRAPGQPAKLTYQKYDTDPVKWQTFNDGGTYTIPRGFADQINEYYHTPQFVQKEGAFEHSQVVGENSQIAYVDTSNKKYSFVPLTF